MHNALPFCTSKEFAELRDICEGLRGELEMSKARRDQLYEETTSIGTWPSTNQENCSQHTNSIVPVDKLQAELKLISELTELKDQVRSLAAELPPLCVRMDAFESELRRVVDEALQGDPAMLTARLTGNGSVTALQEMNIALRELHLQDVPADHKCLANTVATVQAFRDADRPEGCGAHPASARRQSRSPALSPQLSRPRVSHPSPCLGQSTGTTPISSCVRQAVQAAQRPAAKAVLARQPYSPAPGGLPWRGELAQGPFVAVPLGQEQRPAAAAPLQQLQASPMHSKSSSWAPFGNGLPSPNGGSSWPMYGELHTSAGSLALGAHTRESRGGAGGGRLVPQMPSIGSARRDSLLRL